jgi:hypothetical protein
MSDDYFNAIDAGLASDNNANVNAAALQRLTDSVAAVGGDVIMADLIASPTVAKSS